MLAKIAWASAPEPAPEIDYSGFPFWHVLVTEPGREARAAEWLKRFNVHVYLPLFAKRVRKPHGRCAYRSYAVLPGLMFLPADCAPVRRFDDMLELARIRGFMRNSDGSPWRLLKAAIERIRIIEGRLNKPDSPRDARGTELAITQRVRFVTQANDDIFGESVVFEVASFNRIGVETRKLFGRAVKLYVPASEIEVM